MPLSPEFKFTKNPNAPFNVAHNLRVISGIALVHIDAAIAQSNGMGATIIDNAFTKSFDIPSSLEALALTFEQAQAWCESQGLTVEQLLQNQALTEDQKKQIPTILDLSKHAMEKYPPKPQEHVFLGPVTENLVK